MPRSIRWIPEDHAHLRADVTSHGVVANATSHVLAIFNEGREVRRDVLRSTGTPFARVRASIKFESSLTMRMGRGSSAKGLAALAMVKARAQSRSRSRDGADTTVVADELRLLDANPRGGAPTTLSEFIRARNIGEIRIRAEEVIENPRKSK